jgi:hypothetical protein
VALGTWTAFLASALGVSAPQPAFASAKTKKWLMIGAAAITGYCLIKNKRTVAAVGAVGTYLAYRSYRKSKRKEQVEAARRASYSRPYRYSSTRGVRYYRTNASTSSPRHYRRFRTSTVRRHYVAPRQVATTSYRKAPVRYAALRPASYQKPPTGQPYGAFASAPATYGAAGSVPGYFTPGYVPTNTAANPRPLNDPAAARNVSATSAETIPVPATATTNALHPASFLGGFLLALIAGGLGFAASHLTRRDRVVR